MSAGDGTLEPGACAMGCGRPARRMARVILDAEGGWRETRSATFHLSAPVCGPCYRDLDRATDPMREWTSTGWTVTRVER